MAKVKMLVYTGWDGQALQPGMEIEVAQSTADRWAKLNIASTVQAEEPAVIVEKVEPTVAELKEQAKELGIAGYGKMKKQELIDVVAAADELNQEDETEEIITIDPAE